jgi:hypothetical protein
VTESLVISERYRTPITAQRHMDDPDGVVLRTAKSMLILSGAEFDRLVEFVRDEPRLGKLIAFPMGLNRPQSGE